MKKVILLVVISLFFPMVALALPFQPLPLIQVVTGCTDPNSINYNPLANQGDGSCIPIVKGCMESTALNYDDEANVQGEECYWGGASFAILLPKVNNDANLSISSVGDKVTVTFLASKFSRGALLVDEVSQPFALSTYGYPTLDGWSVADLGENYGYEHRVDGEGVNTFHTISFHVDTGIYYVRPVMIHGGEVLGQEMIVVVY